MVTAVPWIALGIGVLLALLGLAMLRGYHLSANFADRLAQRMGTSGTANMRGFFVFGVAYATASLSCTLPIFLTVVGGSLTASSFGGSATQFISYALGMGSIILALTISIAVFKGTVVGKIRNVLPYLERVSALLLIIAGTYIIYHLSANFADRLAQRMGNPGTANTRGFFVFGVAYATASLSCTLPIFLTVVGGSLTASSFGGSATQFISYALGMGSIILALTISIAVFKGTVVGKIRNVLPYLERVSALLLIIAGTYIIYYWLFKGRLIEVFL